METDHPPAVASPTTSLLLEKQFCFTLYAANLAMSKVYRKQLQTLGITYSQYLVLMVLWEQGTLTVSDIGTRLFLDSATLTPLLKRMAANGLITRQRGISDERQVIITLTEAGDALKQKLLPVAETVFCATGCSDVELLQLQGSLEKLRKQLAAFS